MLELLTVPKDYSAPPREDLPDMTPEEIEAFVTSHEFVTAKTMPNLPHAYLARKRARCEKEWCRFVLHVRRHGYKAKFGRYVYRYLDWPSPDGTVYQYWTMGMPIYMTHILNRAVKKTPVVAPVEPFEPFEPFEAFSFDTR